MFPEKCVLQQLTVTTIVLTNRSPWLCHSQTLRFHFVILLALAAFTCSFTYPFQAFCILLGSKILWVCMSGPYSILYKIWSVKRLYQCLSRCFPRRMSVLTGLRVNTQRVKMLLPKCVQKTMPKYGIFYF